MKNHDHSNRPKITVFLQNITNIALLFGVIIAFFTYFSSYRATFGVKDISTELREHKESRKEEIIFHINYLNSGNLPAEKIKMEQNIFIRSRDNKTNKPFRKISSNNIDLLPQQTFSSHLMINLQNLRKELYVPENTTNPNVLIFEINANYEYILFFFPITWKRRVSYEAIYEVEWVPAYTRTFIVHLLKSETN